MPTHTYIIVEIVQRVVGWSFFLFIIIIIIITQLIVINIAPLVELFYNCLLLILVSIQSAFQFDVINQ